MNTAASTLTKKQQAKLFKVHGISAAQWESFNPIQQQALIVAGANRVDVTQEAFQRLGIDPAMQFRDLGADEEAEFRKWARDNYVAGAEIDLLWHPSVQDECAKMNAEVAADKEPSVDDLGANTVGKRKSSGPRTGAAMGAKPHVRMLLGTANPDGQYPKMTMEDICTVTKKSQINIRTILSDLRSPKYCGNGGVFMTTSTKVDGKTYYQYAPPAADA